jgi:hypothetical protein
MEDVEETTTTRVTSPRGVTFDFSSIMGLEESRKGKEKARLPDEWRQNASRRASMAGQDLSNSVSLPPKSVGLMGPPGHTVMRSTSSSYPSSSGSDPSMRRSTRIGAKSVEPHAGSDDAVPGEAASRPGPTPIQPLTTLKGCVVYVDIISEFGDDSAKSFITDMLKNLGARVRVFSSLFAVY